MILNKKLNIHQYAIHCYAVVLWLTCEGIRSENWKDTWSSLSVMTTSEQCSEGEGGRGHYTPVSLLARAAAGLHRRSSQGQLLQYLCDTMRQRQYIYCMNSVQYMLHLRCCEAQARVWTVEHIDSQTSKAKIVSGSIYFLPLFLFYRRLVGGWRSVRVSAALPGYLTSLSVVGLDSGTAGLPCTTPHSSTVPQSVSILSSISCLCFRSVGARFLWVSSYSASTSPSQDCSKSGGLNVSLLKASSFLLMTIFVNLCYPLPC